MVEERKVSLGPVGKKRKRKELTHITAAKSSDRLTESCDDEKGGLLDVREKNQAPRDREKPRYFQQKNEEGGWSDMNVTRPDHAY